MDIFNERKSATARENLLSASKTEQVKRIVGELYREGSRIGNGGTADAIRSEKRTGEKVGGKSHLQKGEERLRQIEKILKEFPDHPDRGILEFLRKDLQDALKG